MSEIKGPITLDDVSKCLCILQEFLTDNPNWIMGVDYTEPSKVNLYVREKDDYEKMILECMERMRAYKRSRAESEDA